MGKKENTASNVSSTFTTYKISSTQSKRGYKMQPEERIETNGVLWIVCQDGHIIKKKGNYTQKEAPLLYEYPEIPPKEDGPALSNWYNNYEMAEQQNYFFAQKWIKHQKKKLNQIKANYRKQQIMSFTEAVIKKIFGNIKQR